MSEYKDITGQKFGRLTAIKYLGIEKHKAVWLCKCECGNTVEVPSNSLTCNNTKSCGCLHHDMMLKRNTKHNKRNTRLYNIWANMKQRCYNENNTAYKNYGERGIDVCDEWKDDFMAFHNWAMDNCYNDNLTIDRIDNDGNYEPENCRWVDRNQQARNKRNNVNYTINGVTRCLKDWCKIQRLNYGTVISRLHDSNWTIREALELDTEDIYADNRR